MGWLASGQRPRLGLDLQGGISVILSPVEQPGQPVDTGVLDETIEIIRSRVDSLGVAEPEIARQGDDVLVQLPGIEDRDRALEVIGRTAKLTFRPVLETIRPTDARYEEAGLDCATNPRPEEPIADDDEAVVCGSPESEEAGAGATGETLPAKYRVGPAALTGGAIADASAAPIQTGQGVVTNNWEVLLDLNREGAGQFAEITADLACQRDEGDPGGGQLAIVLDDIVESAPTMSPDVACGRGITGGQAVITVGGSEQAARDLSIVLKSGALPITLEPSTAFNVSATLGARSLEAGIIAGLIGIGLVALYLVAFYRWIGLVAVGGLVVFGATILGLVTLLGEVGFTLTLAGIAGIIVSIGIAADSSILYFERIRDELQVGKTTRTAVMRAFPPAFRTNLTGNTVTIAAAIILWFLAVGPVRGFAFTLGLSTAIDLIILWFFTRPAVQLLGGSRFLVREGERVRVPAAEGGSP